MISLKTLIATNHFKTAKGIVLSNATRSSKFGLISRIRLENPFYLKKMDGALKWLFK